MLHQLLHRVLLCFKKQEEETGSLLGTDGEMRKQSRWTPLWLLFSRIIILKPQSTEQQELRGGWVQHLTESGHPAVCPALP